MGEVTLNVRLLSATAEPETTIALSGRLCYSDSDIASLHGAVADSADKFVDRLIGYGHLSPIEHASFTFGIEGVSRALLAQITRHRIASFSVQSQRYVTKDELTYIVPPSIAALGEEATSEYCAQMDSVRQFYTHWLNLGIPAEDARFVLPNAAETRMIMTMNARELLHFFELRCCERAQWEIRRLAWCMLGMAIREAPSLFALGGPPCISSACHEGKLSCKRTEAVKRNGAALLGLAKSGASDADILEWVMGNIHNENTQIQK
ncbi:MAG: FAD-dependent thymidylate synthase [Clostridia bacterium]